MTTHYIIVKETLARDGNVAYLVYRQRWWFWWFVATHGSQESAQAHVDRLVKAGGQRSIRETLPIEGGWPPLPKPLPPHPPPPARLVREP